MIITINMNKNIKNTQINMGNKLKNKSQLH